MTTPQTGSQPEDQRPGGTPRQPGDGKHGFMQSLKGPLVFSLVLALIGGVVATLTASGGSDKPVRFDIGLIAFGVFFMVTLVVVAMLQLAAKDNPEHLSQGSGVHRSSEELHRQAVARRKAEAQRRRENPDTDAPGASGAPGTPGASDASGEPR